MEKIIFSKWNFCSDWRGFYYRKTIIDDSQLVTCWIYGKSKIPLWKCSIGSDEVFKTKEECMNFADTILLDMGFILIDKYKDKETAILALL